MSISRDDIANRHIKTLSISVNHVMRYIDIMGKKDKKTMSDVYPIEMTENNKKYIMEHLQYIYNDLLERFE